ncbi:D123-domain-containing protein [Pisolithus croceorrhizus]|nr:D123-domain-containing protein [Pisolithus croceorrhizus]
MVVPSLTPGYILALQFSNWYPSFTRVSPRSAAISPLGEDFKRYLESDSVFVPEGSEGVAFESTLSDDGDNEREDVATAGEHFSFPELDERIRAVIREYKAVFPKLTQGKFPSAYALDASWALPASSPLKCTTPADIYLLLKAPDFVTHDCSIESVFGCRTDNLSVCELELVLRKWCPVDHSHEATCFVRSDILSGIMQRYTNFYGFIIDLEI